MQKSFFAHWTIFLSLILLVKANKLLVADKNNEITLYYADDNKNQSIRVYFVPFYNTSSGIVQLQISCPDCPAHKYLCRVSVSRIMKSCINNVPIEPGDKKLVFSLGSTALVIPENKDQLIPYLGCSYQFENLKDWDETCEFKGNISIPECIDGACNCNKFNFTFVDMETDLNKDTLTIIAIADFADDLNVYTLAFNLTCGNTVEKLNEIHTASNYKRVIIHVSLKDHDLPYGQICQIDLFYLNPYNCDDAYQFMIFHFPNDTSSLTPRMAKIIQKSFFVLIVFCGLPILAIIAVIGISRTNVKTNTSNVNTEVRVTQQTFLNALYSVHIEDDEDAQADQYECNHEQIRMIQSIGQGEFGNVFLAKSDSIYKKYGRVYSYIAVKKLKGNATEQAKTDFLREMNIMLKITDFTHVVRILGFCTKVPPLMLITEYICSGDLRSYLIDLRELWKSTTISKLYSGEYLDTNLNDAEPPDTPTSTSSDRNSRITKYSSLSQQSPLISHEDQFDYELEVVLDSAELQNFALQIAKGMTHLESIPILHRDLAARNVLVTECKILKISDFGLSCIGDSCSVLRDKQKVPARWTALDVFETRKYDLKSDVWSFAVVLWEIGMLGAYPYQNIDNAELVTYLKNDMNRLEKPPICSEALYELMLRCWSRDSSLRPSFRDLVDLLDKRKRIYKTFDFVNPTYIFPPTEESSKAES